MCVCVCLRVYLRVTYACCMSKCTAASGHGRDSAYACGDDKAGTEMIGMRIRMSKTNMNTKKPSTPMCEACFW